MNLYPADLHVHTALSPCAAPEMTPRAIVREARERRMAILAICDHNAAGNVAAVQAAAGSALCIVPGIEITTSEEVHLVGLFPTVNAAGEAARVVQQGLPQRRGAGRGFGPQTLFGPDGEPAGEEPRLLAAASSLSLTEATTLIAAGGGLTIAAHIDRPSFGVLSQLGFIPAGLRFDALEITAAAAARGESERFESFGPPVISASDSHELATLGEGFMVFELEEPSFPEIALAFRALYGRRCWIA